MQLNKRKKMKEMIQILEIRENVQGITKELKGMKIYFVFLEISFTIH